MNFRRNQAVEVMIPEDGFQNSYYQTQVLHCYAAVNVCHIEYDKLLTDSMEKPLREQVQLDCLRPVPPVVIHDFQSQYVVDARYNDGWWKGVVVQKQGDGFVVHFDEQDEDWGYPFKLLRLHQEYENGEWIF